VLDLQSRSRVFESQSGNYQMVTGWMGNCLQTGRPSWYIIKIKPALHLSGVGKLSIGLSGWG